MKQKPQTFIFDHPQALASGFAKWFYDLVNDKPSISVALSGGSTPKLFFQVLNREYRQKIDWAKIQVFWGDERCVPPGHEDSNFRMTYENLLDHVAIREQNIHRIHGESDPTLEAERYAQVIGEFLPQTDNLPMFDLVILGLGTDGHTASIFPGQMDLLKSDQFCQVAAHPESGQQRITLTGRIINHAANICFLVAGQGKSGVLAEILNKTGNWEKYPASYIKSNSGGTLHWFLDREAAAGLQK